MSEVPADAILEHARIYTGDDVHPLASVVAIRDKEIVYVGGGGDGSPDELVGPDTDVVDVEGRAIIPGLVDSHTHPELVALSSWHVALPRTDDLNTILDFLRGYAAAHTVADAPFIYAEYYPSDMDWGPDGPYGGRDRQRRLRSARAAAGLLGSRKHGQLEDARAHGRGCAHADAGGPRGSRASVRSRRGRCQPDGVGPGGRVVAFRRHHVRRDRLATPGGSHPRVARGILELPVFQRRRRAVGRDDQPLHALFGGDVGCSGKAQPPLPRREGLLELGQPGGEHRRCSSLASGVRRSARQGGHAEAVPRRDERVRHRCRARPAHHQRRRPWPAADERRRSDDGHAEAGCRRASTCISMSSETAASERP